MVCNKSSSRSGNIQFDILKKRQGKLKYMEFNTAVASLKAGHYILGLL